jgi:hypothetical protein
MAMGMSSKFGKMDASKNSYGKISKSLVKPAQPAGQDFAKRQARMQAMKKRVAGR